MADQYEGDAPCPHANLTCRVTATQTLSWAKVTDEQGTSYALVDSDTSEQDFSTSYITCDDCGEVMEYDDIKEEFD